MDLVRKSGRQRIPNKKYQDDALETLNNLLSSDSEEEAIIQQQAVDPGVDEDFQEEAAIEISSDSDSGSSSNVSDGSAIATPVEDYEDAHSYASSETDIPVRVSQNRYRPKSKNQWETRVAGVRSRGITDNSFTSKRSRPIIVTGPGKEHIAHLARSRDQWGDDMTLPRRASMRYCFSHTKEKRQMEATSGWNWYYDHGGRTTFTKNQHLSALGEEEGAKYIIEASRAKYDVLLGPYGRQKLFSIPVLQSLDIDDSWSIAKDKDLANIPQIPQKKKRLGWMLHTGNRVRCLDWAANQNGDLQYLAIATKRDIPKEVLKEAPSFTPSPPIPSSIQIWQFSASPERAPKASSINMDCPPVLYQVLCTEWGDAKQVKWCPMPREFREAEAGERASIGLLAGVWDDGRARVLDVIDQRPGGHGTAYCTLTYHDNYVIGALLRIFLFHVVRVESAACTIIPLSNSICTSLCWLSASDLAIGHSNGFLAIYSIAPKSPTADPPPGNDITPDGLANESVSTTNEISIPTRRALIPIAQTYIMSLTTAYPSFPTLLMSSSASGYTRLTSLLSPTSSYVQSRRSTNAPPVMVYHHALYGCIFPDDGKEIVTYTGLRFWGNGVGAADAAGCGGVAAVDVGKVHAAVAFGTADGRVVVTTPIEKIIQPREQGWQQTIFKHEWVKKRVQVAGDKGDANNDDSGKAIEGLSRITESYKPQPADVDRSFRGNVAATIHGASKLTTTIYEEETGTTAVCWNPNLSCGGWLAVGWGSGLVRVEDVAI